MPAQSTQPRLLHCLAAATLIASLGLPTAPLAQVPVPAGTQPLTAFTWGEIALLPDWCIDSQAGIYGGPEGGAYMNKSPRAPHWVSLMGRDFWHMHHYCYALRDLMRSKKAGLGPAKRQQLYERARNDLYYVINNCGPKMPLLPEVFLKLGEVLTLLGDPLGAESAYARSRALKPDYWPAYTASIDSLLGRKMYAQALELAQAGVAAAPASAELKARLAQVEKAMRATPSAAAASAR